jgi:hypothetical protein
MGAIVLLSSEVDMIKRVGNAVEVEIGNMRALFVNSVPVVVFDGWDIFVTTEPRGETIQRQIGKYVAFLTSSIGDATIPVRFATQEKIKTLVN